ncbi:MAG TPA: tetratricopeptide repeat protein [Nitrososphaeraceae archaeon]|nr:tetratricopeptide repeat protein [Nitrososphaeraceae archaeon]
MQSSNDDYLSELESLRRQLPLLESEGRITEVINVVKQISLIYTRNGNAYNPENAVALTKLGSLYRLEGMREEAISYHLQGLDAFRVCLSKGQTNEFLITWFINSLQELALLFRDNGQIMKAETLYKEVVEVTRKIFGESTQHYISALYNLALFYRDIGEYGTSEALFQQCMERGNNLVGEYHPMIAEILNSVGVLYYIKSSVIINVIIPSSKSLIKIF